MKSIRQQWLDTVALNYAFVDTSDSYTPIEILLSIILGQYFKDKIKIKFGRTTKDLRISFFWIQNMRSGKGEALKALKDLCSELGLAIAKMTTLTDAGLIGTYDHAAEEFNYKHDLVPDNIKYKSPVIYGDLYDKDIIMFEESKNILNPNTHTELCLTIMQEALDTPGFIRKKLGAKSAIEFESTSSIIGTTYYMEQIHNVLMQQGFFQRVIIYLKEYTSSENLKLRNKIIDIYDTSVKDTKNEYDAEIKKLAQRIKNIKITNNEFCVTQEALQLLKDLQTNYHMYLTKTTGAHLKILLGFSQTILDTSIKLGAISAIMHEKKDIDRVCINYGHNIVKACVDTVVNKLEAQKDSTKENVQKIIRLYQNLKEPLTKTEFINLVNVNVGIGIYSARTIINQLIAEEQIKLKTTKV